MGRRDDDGGIGGILAGIGALVGLGAAAYGIYKGVKNKKSAPALSSPFDYIHSDDFSEGPFGTLHNVYCRIIPAVATLISAAGFCNIITENGDEKNIYVEFVNKTLKEEGAPTDYVSEFITGTIIRISKECIGNEDNIEFYRDVLSEAITDIYEDNKSAAKTILLYSLDLTQSLRGASISELLAFGSELDLSSNEIKSILNEAGYQINEFDNPSLPITVDSLEDICNFNDDPVNLSYGTTAHLLFCRVAPAIGTIASYLSQEDIRDYQDFIDNYIEKIEEEFGDVSFPNELVEPFVESTIDDVMSRGDNMLSLSQMIGEIINSYDYEIKLTIIEESIKITGKMGERGWRFFRDIANLSDKELTEIVEKTGYGHLDFSFDEETTNPYGSSDKEKIKRCLKVLGLEYGVSLDQVKRSFKVLSMKFHPDMIAGKGLDEEFIQFATMRFQEINEAYEYLKTIMH